MDPLRKKLRRAELFSLMVIVPVYKEIGPKSSCIPNSTLGQMPPIALGRCSKSVPPNRAVKGSASDTGRVQDVGD